MLAVIALFGGASAYAEDGGNNPGGPMGWLRGMFGGNHQQPPQNQNGSEDNASSTHPFPQGMGMREGMMGRGRDNASSTFRGERRGMMGSSTRPMMIGRPVVGTIASINGYSFTVTDRANKTFTVDASNAKITTRGTTPTSTPTTITVSDLTVGENVAVEGQVSTSTSSVVANQIFAGILGPRPEGSNASSTEMNNGQHEGFFQKVGNFFGHLFGR